MQHGGYAEVPEGASAVPLHKRGEIVGYALVDEADFELVNKYRWHIKHGYVATSTYPRGKAGGPVTVYMHRLILGLDRGDKTKVDHRSHDPLDNRRENIRVCSHAENHQNRYSHRGSSSQYRGVSWNSEARKWRAIVGKVYLGDFDREADAARVASEYRAQHMPFAVEPKIRQPRPVRPEVRAAVLGFLNDHYGGRAKRVATMVRHLNLTDVQIRRALRELEDAGEVRTVNGGWLVV